MSNRVSYYHTTALPVPPLVAQAAYDAQQLRQHTRIRTVGPRGWMRIRGEAVVSSGTDYAPFRSQPAVVVAGARMWPVRLELLPWSDAQTELGLRPLGRSWSGFPPDSILAVGDAALGIVADALTCWAEAPLREALSGSHVGTTSAAPPIHRTSR
jgi:hypothetical protein